MRAALQVNPFLYQGRNAPSTKFPDEASYNQALIAECKNQNIEIIAITDHWCVDSAQDLIKYAEQEGITALPGFEAVSNEGIHLLVIFEVGTSASVISGAIGACGGTPGGGSGKVGHPYDDILTKMAELGALVIPAHANVANGGLLHRQSGVPLQERIKHPDLHAIGITPSQPAGTDQAAILAGHKPYNRTHKIAEIYSDDISQPGALATPGAATWFKLSKPTLEGIRLAVRMPHTRVATADPTTAQRTLIRSISWQGGFLDGVAINLANDLTAIIGGRGTGKSTVIESLRFALEIEPIGDDAQRDHRDIVSKVLRPATMVEVTVDAISPRAGRYVIRRSVHNPPMVFDPSGSATSLKPVDVVGIVEIFGQHELAELAQDKALVARMLERFAGHDGTNEAKQEILRKLADNRDTLTKAESRKDNIDSKLADLPRLKDQLAHFEADGLPEKLKEQERLTKDSGVFVEGNSRLTEAKELIDTLSDETALESLEREIDDIAESTESGTLRRVETATKQLAAAIKQAAATLATAMETAQAEIDAAKADWSTRTDAIRQGHAAALTKLREEGYDPDKYLATAAAIASLKGQESDRSGVEAQLKKLIADRQELLKKLRAAETADEKRLKDAIRKANNVTNKVVNVRATFAPDRSEIKNLIEHTVQGARTQIRAAIDTENFSTTEFVATVRTGASAVEQKYNIKGSQLSNLITAGEPLLRQLEELHVGYAADVYLNVAQEGNTEWRLLDNLSKGQRATALLMLLLGASSSPLVIDQPEDDLDNRFVYEGVVKKICELKGSRQLIVSTHNANVPVLGDAELIITLEGDGSNGWPKDGGVGSLDEESVRKIAEGLLEGGPDAFVARKHLYGV
ncbi:ATPase involved in DNA repair [Mycobacteroides abscessus subsp. abscessus]|nr:ATPase involved in DNA repair [Mycobacteroides abscessus subsp. abscessus]